MPIDAGKIVLLVVILTGFFGLMYMLKTKLNKSCTSGDVYDDKLDKCIKDCSLVPGTRYDSDKDECIQNCQSGYQMCGTTGCYDTTLQQCINDNFVCNSWEQLCPADGSGSPVCYNPNTEKCIGGVVYANAKACSDTIGCGPDTQCSNDNTKCISCPDTSGFCKGSDTCCPTGQVCASDGKTCTICAGGTTSCGNGCYTSGTQICCPDNKTICNSNQTCCNGNCCDAGTTCVNGACCQNDRVFDIGNGKKACCASELCNGKCCSDPNTVCQNGKCMTICGDQFCDISNNEECLQVGTTSRCIHLDCQFDNLYYTPNLLFDDSAKPLNVFQQLNGNKVNLYIANPRNVPGLTRVSSVDTLGGTCDVDDCIYKLSQKDVEFLNIPIEYSATGGKQGLGQCTATFGTNILNKPGWCPWAQHSERCCSDANGLTGQVCKEGQTCYGNMCTSCVDANCNGYGKCSRTVADTCVCDHGHDPQSQCQNCLPGLTVKTINGYNYCVTGDVQSFNYWNLDQGSYSSGWAVLTTDDNKYINGGHDGRNVVVSFNANLISDGIKKIIFEPTGDINVLTQYQLRQFPGDILVSVFGNSNTISTIDVTNDLIYSGFNYYLEVYVSDACKVKFNVYFSK
jgi:hypothetical protein